MQNPRSSYTYVRQGSLIQSETAFFDAAVQATHATGDGANDDPNALHDARQMIKVATSFLEKACPEYLEALELDENKNDAMDRLIKVGRNVSSTLRFERRRSRLKLNQSQDQEEEEESPAVPKASIYLCKAKTDASLSLLAEECHAMVSILRGSEERRVPTVRYGRTEIQIPIVTLGGMRFQQSWNRDGADPVVSMDQVEHDCQSNLTKTLKYAIRMGMTHIETAKGYGSSELQLGNALKQLFESGFCKRQELIIQTKGGVSSSMTKDEYKQLVEAQLNLLQLDYVDLFSVHGINTADHLEWLFGPNNLFDALVELKQENKIRHVGFSTHACASLIEKTIRTDKFDYVNLHYHFCGSYTSSGDGPSGGNLSNIQLAHELDMGVFIISPYDKGGRVYAPSNKLRDLTLPDMEPMTFASTWLWQHHQIVSSDEGTNGPPIHTIVCGAARASDLDQPIVAALSFATHPQETLEKSKAIYERLRKSMNDAIGKEFADTWHCGLPNWLQSKYGTQLGNIVWMHNIIKAYGLRDYCEERYSPLEPYLEKWSLDKSHEENADNMGPAWSWVPGCAYNPSLDYAIDVQHCPPNNQRTVLEALGFVHKWCGKNGGQDNQAAATPLEWETSYDMRPWTAFPER